MLIEIEIVYTSYTVNEARFNDTIQHGPVNMHMLFNKCVKTSQGRRRRRSRRSSNTNINVGSRICEYIFIHKVI